MSVSNPCNKNIHVLLFFFFPWPINRVPRKREDKMKYISTKPQPWLALRIWGRGKTSHWIPKIQSKLIYISKSRYIFTNPNNFWWFVDRKVAIWAGNHKIVEWIQFKLCYPFDAVNGKNKTTIPSDLNVTFGYRCVMYLDMNHSIPDWYLNMLNSPKSMKMARQITLKDW